MLPFGIGFSEIIVVFLVLIIFVGPEGLPQAVRGIAKVIRSIRSMIDEIKYSAEFDEVKRELLEPLEEARRFNPKQKAEAWIKKEIETPIRDLSTQQVQDFEKAFETKSKEKPSNPDLIDSVEHKTDTATALHQHKEEANDEEADEDLETQALIATLDPLERGLSFPSGTKSEHPTLKEIDENKQKRQNQDRNLEEKALGEQR